MSRSMRRREAIYALPAPPPRARPNVFVSSGYDIQTFPALAERVGTLARAEPQNNITIFAIDRVFLPLFVDSRIHLLRTPLTALHDRHATLAWAMMAEETGGFVIDKCQ